MPQHAYWTGHVRLSLVTFPVRLYPAVSQSEKIRLHKYDKETGQRIRYQNINEDGEVVEPEDIVRGYEYEKGSFVPIEDDEFEQLRQESKHTVDLVSFTDLSDIDPIYFDSPYFMAPDGDIAQEAYITVRDALRKTRKIALGQVILSNRERIVAIKACGKGLIMETLRYNYEVRSAEEYFDDVKVETEPNEDQIALAEELIRMKSAKFDPRTFKDKYQEGLKEIINAKVENRKPDIEEEAPTQGKVINIMDALRRSLEQSGGKTADGKKKTKSASKKKAAAKPGKSSGKKATKTAAKSDAKNKAAKGKNKSPKSKKAA